MKNLKLGNIKRYLVVGFVVMTTGLASTTETKAGEVNVDPNTVEWMTEVDNYTDEHPLPEYVAEALDEKEEVKDTAKEEEAVEEISTLFATPAAGEVLEQSEGDIETYDKNGNVTTEESIAQTIKDNNMTVEEFNALPTEEKNSLVDQHETKEVYENAEEDNKKEYEEAKKEIESKIEVTTGSETTTTVEYKKDGETISKDKVPFADAETNVINTISDSDSYSTGNTKVENVGTKECDTFVNGDGKIGFLPNLNEIIPNILKPVCVDEKVTPVDGDAQGEIEVNEEYKVNDSYDIDKPIGGDPQGNDYQDINNSMSAMDILKIIVPIAFVGACIGALKSNKKSKSQSVYHSKVNSI